MKSLVAALSAVLLITSAAVADCQKNVGVVGDWSVWRYSTGEHKGCFIYANPLKSSPKSVDHGLVSFFLRSTKRKDVRAEASLQFGYDQSRDAGGRVKVGSKTFRLMADHKAAWLARARDTELLDAMKTGSLMTVSTVSGRGNKTVYEFPLKGVTEAMRLMRRHCPRSK